MKVKKVYVTDTELTPVERMNEQETNTRTTSEHGSLPNGLSCYWASAAGGSLRASPMFRLAKSDA